MVTAPVHKVARFKVKSDELPVVLDAIRAFVQVVRDTEAGTLHYESYVEADGTTFLHFMTFEDEAAEERHRATPHVKAFVDVLYPRCEIEPVFTDLTLV